MTVVEQFGFSKIPMRANRPVRGPSIITRLLNLLHRCICIVVRLAMRMFYGEHGKSMPPIEDRLLLEPATSIAEKIRTKEVNFLNLKKKTKIHTKFHDIGDSDSSDDNVYKSNQADKSAIELCD